VQNYWVKKYVEECVQLIVFFAAIREILKREIYGGDKQHFCLVKTKGQFEGGGEPDRVSPI
jgi:hypothetical protein